MLVIEIEYSKVFVLGEYGKTIEGCDGRFSGSCSGVYSGLLIVF